MRERNGLNLLKLNNHSSSSRDLFAASSAASIVVAKLKSHGDKMSEPDSMAHGFKQSRCCIVEDRGGIK